VVLADSFVDPLQLRLIAMPAAENASAPRWRVLLSSATNPVFVNGRMLLEQQADLCSGDRLTLGRTTLQLFDSEHSVPPTDRFVLSNWLTHHAIGPWRALFAFVLLVMFAYVSQYLTHYQSNQWQDIVSGTLIPPSILIVWVSIWAFVGRLLRGHPLFSPHFFFAALGACVLLALWDVHGYMAFMTNSESLALVADTVVFSVVMGVTLGFQLSLASRLRHVFTIGIFFCLGLAVLAGVLALSSQDLWAAQAQHNTALKPPFVPSPSGRSIDEFISSYDELVQKLPKTPLE
jgi:hypothetical protein